MNTSTLFQPDYGIHPGETLAETLEELGMSQAELAQRMGRPLQMISEIIQGKKAITAETALQLERATGVPANFWNSSQRNYEATLARFEEDRGLAPDSAWLKQFPLRSLISRRWIPECDSPPEQMRAVLNFFGVAGIKEWSTLWTAPDVAYRKSAAFETNPMAAAAWLRQGERVAQQIRTEPYNQEAFFKALHEIRRLTKSDPKVFIPRATDLCRAAGVALVFVPEPPATRAYGATRWITSSKAILQLSLRGKTDDFLWFTFFHETAHILKHGKRDVFIEEPDGTGEPITVPSAAFRLLLTILSEMARGNAVRVIPHHAELTTGEAAELLNVSRPYVVRLLDEGQIPSHRVGTHRHVLFNDVMAYRDEHYRARSAVLDRMAAIDQELGLT